MQVPEHIDLPDCGRKPKINIMTFRIICSIWQGRTATTSRTVHTGCLHSRCLFSTDIPNTQNMTRCCHRRPPVTGSICDQKYSMSGSHSHAHGINISSQALASHSHPLVTGSISSQKYSVPGSLSHMRSIHTSSRVQSSHSHPPVTGSISSLKYFVPGSLCHMHSIHKGSRALTGDSHPLVTGSISSQKYSVPASHSHTRSIHISSQALASQSHPLVTGSNSSQKYSVPASHGHTRSIHTSSRALAGHSHWQNIKHTKAAKDKERSAAITALCNEIRAAIKVANGIADPKLNRRLAVAMDRGKKQNIPMAPLQRAIRKATEAAGSGGTEVLVGFRGPRGSAFVAVCDSGKPQVMKNAVQAAVKKFGLRVDDLSSVLAGFESKGLLQVSVSQLAGKRAAQESGTDDARSSASEDPMDLAIQVGAEDVHETTSVDGDPVYEFVSDPKEFHRVRTELGKHCETDEATLGYRASHRVELTAEECEVVDQCIQKVYENPDVIRIYDNIA